MLQANDISFSYRQTARPVLSRFSFTLHPGERVGLSAPSGTGKTTLCKILAGYEPPGSGQVLLDGAPLSTTQGPSPVQLLWQHPELVLNPRLRLGRSLAEAGPLPARITEGLGIEPAWLQRYPGELSGGELQRFCIARALGDSTRFLLADEISAMLDPIAQSQIWNFLLAETARRDIGLLAVSHSESLLAQICTRRITFATA